MQACGLTHQDSWSSKAKDIYLDHIEQTELARRILDREYTTSITIERLSDEVALSPYYLIRLFHRTYKLTPHQYVMQLRIKKAKELLVNSDLSITAICTDIGYQSLGSFSTLFTKTVGIPPSAYRANRETIRSSAYIPLCTCFLHGIHDTIDS